MKKKITLSIALAIFLIYSANAQIEKKDWLLGGTFGFSGSNSASNGIGSTGSTSNASIEPHIGYAIGKNSVMGLNLGYADYDNSGNSKTSTFSTNIFYEKYFPIREKFGAYVQVNAGYAWSRNSYLVDSLGTLTRSRSSGHAYNTGIIPGVYYRVCKNILLTANGGGIQYVYYDYGAGDWASSWSINFLSNFTFGVDFILGKK